MHSILTAAWLKRIGVLFFLVAVVAWFLYDLSHSSSDHPPRLSNRACPSIVSSSFSVHCYYYRTHPNGGFYLPMALLRGDRRVGEKQRPLLVYIPGGPGQGYMTSADNLQYWADWMDVNHVGFDILLFDPRGSGESIPNAYCHAYHRRVRELLGEDIALKDEYTELNGILMQCFSDYQGRLQAHIPDASYDVLATKQQAHDVDGMLAALGYSQAHLWGVSYGTRFALLAAQSDRVKSLILDSPYPFSAGQYSDWLVLYERSFTLFDTLYLKYAERKKDDTDFRSVYQKAHAGLQKAPLDVSVRHWASGRYQRLVLSANRLLELSFSVLYSPHLYDAYFSGLAYFAHTGRMPEEWNPVLEDFYNNIVDKHFSFLSYFAVECLDNAKEDQVDVLRKLNEVPDIADYFSTGLDFDICGDVGFSNNFAVQGSNYSDKPVLIFSGQYDPVTPAERGEKLAQRFTLAQFFLLPNTGHGSLQSQNCDWQFIDRFIVHGTVPADMPCQAAEHSWP